jgi:hypothetical protein
MHAATSKVENSAQGLSCKLKFVHGLADIHYNGPMEKHALKNVSNCLNTNIYSYLETSDGQSSNLYLNGFPFFNTSVS